MVAASLDKRFYHFGLIPNFTRQEQLYYYYYMGQAAILDRTGLQLDVVSKNRPASETGRNMYNT